MFEYIAIAVSFSVAWGLAFFALQVEPFQWLASALSERNYILFTLIRLPL